MRYFLVLLTVFSIWACQSDDKQNTESEPSIASDTAKTMKPKTPEYENRYIIAASGLRMRKTPALNGEKMDVIAYGETVRIDLSDATPIPPVDGFQGQMVKVKYGEVEGYMFDGFLSALPVPKAGETSYEDIKKYARLLKIKGFKTEAKEKTSEISVNYVFSLPTPNFQEAFLIARQLDLLPTTFTLPSPEKPNQLVINDNGIKKTLKAEIVKEEGNSTEHTGGLGTFYQFELPAIEDYTILTQFMTEDDQHWHTFSYQKQQEYHFQKTIVRAKNGGFEIEFEEFAD